MIRPRIAWDIEIREIDNGLIVTVENQDNIKLCKFYCKDIIEVLKEISVKLKERQTEE